MVANFSENSEILNSLLIKDIGVANEANAGFFPELYKLHYLSNLINLLKPGLESRLVFYNPLELKSSRGKPNESYYCNKSWNDITEHYETYDSSGKEINMNYLEGLFLEDDARSIEVFGFNQQKIFNFIVDENNNEFIEILKRREKAYLKLVTLSKIQSQNMTKFLQNDQETRDAIEKGIKKIQKNGVELKQNTTKITSLNIIFILEVSIGTPSEISNLMK